MGIRERWWRHRRIDRSASARCVLRRELRLVISNSPFVPRGSPLVPPTFHIVAKVDFRHLVPGAVAAQSYVDMQRQ